MYLIKSSIFGIEDMRGAPLCRGVEEKRGWVSSRCVFLCLSEFAGLYKFTKLGDRALMSSDFSRHDPLMACQWLSTDPVRCAKHCGTRLLTSRTEGASEAILIHSQEGLERLSDLTKVTQLSRGRAVTALDNMVSSEKEETWSSEDGWVRISWKSRELISDVMLEQ